MLQCVNVNICNFAFFGLIFMKFAPSCRAIELGMLFTSLGSFYLIRIGKGPVFGPKIGVGKSLGYLSLKC